MSGTRAVTSPLDELPGARRWLYRAQWFANLILGVTGVVLVTLGMSPLWFVVTGAALNFVWTYTGTLASANVPAAPQHRAAG